MNYPIPKELLCHTCVLEKYPVEGCFGSGETASSSVTLSNVRCSVYKTLSVSEKSGCTVGNGVLYFDCTESLPADVSFIEDGCRSVILFNGERFAVTSVKYIYGFGQLHHLEVALGEV